MFREVNHRRKRGVAGLLGAIAAAVPLLVPAVSAAALSSPFATFGAGCGSTAGPLLTSAHPNPVPRLTVASGNSTNWNWGRAPLGYGGIYGGGFAAGDSVWGDATNYANNPLPFAVNDAPAVYLNCSGPGSATVEFFDTPGLPVTFSDIVQSPSSANTLSFLVPSTVKLAADLTISQGAVKLSCNGCPPQALSTSTTVGLGSWSGTAGVEGLSIDAQDGPPARYSLAIRPLAVQVSEASTSVALVAPGAEVKQNYKTDGDTNITAAVWQAGALAPARVLATALAVEDGAHSLTWDGRNGAGGALADGSYFVRVASKDPYGGTSLADTPITVDGTAPGVVAQVPTTATSPVVVTASDANGVTEMSAGVDADGDGEFDRYGDEPGASARPSVANGSLSVTVTAPYSGWTAGKTYQLLYAAKDRAGNNATGRTTFVIKAPPTSSSSGGTTNGQSTARVPTLSTASGRYYVRRLIRNRLGSGMAASGNYRIKCGRVSRLRLSCRFSAFVGDSSAKGSGQVWYTTDVDDDEVHYRISVSKLDQYCRYALKRPLRVCRTKTRWSN